MRKLRMERYTPQAAKEVRDWIEGTLGERLGSSDLMEALKDGVALCKYVLNGTEILSAKFLLTTA